MVWFHFSCLEFENYLYGIRCSLFVPVQLQIYLWQSETSIPFTKSNQLNFDLIETNCLCKVYHHAFLDTYYLQLIVVAASCFFFPPASNECWLHQWKMHSFHMRFAFVSSLLICGFLSTETYYRSNSIGATNKMAFETLCTTLDSFWLIDYVSMDFNVTLQRHFFSYRTNCEYVSSHIILVRIFHYSS